MERKGHAKAVELRFSVPECLSLFWQTKYNDVDCGAFTIFHMESYMGDSGGNMAYDIGERNCKYFYMSNVLYNSFYVVV